MSEEDNPPDFEYADHSTIWKSIQKNSDAVESWKSRFKKLPK